MAETTEWFEGLTIDERGLGNAAQAGSRLMPVLWVIALLSTAILSLW